VGKENGREMNKKQFDEGGMAHRKSATKTPDPGKKVSKKKQSYRQKFGQYSDT